MKTFLFASLSLIVLLVQPVHAKTVCTLVADAASGRAISKTVYCDIRATPASTFKLALALIGFDAAITGYLDKIDYGNADFSGDKGRDNAVERAWTGSSLKISPMEQVRFLSRMMNRDLPVKPDAVDLTVSIVEAVAPDSGWLVRGKTGLACPGRADGSFNRARGTGWFVGWAVKGDRRVVFARLIKDEKRRSTGSSRRARASLLKDLPDLVEN